MLRRSCRFRVAHAYRWTNILRNATSRFAARGTDPDLKDDASFYQVLN